MSKISVEVATQEFEKFVSQRRRLKRRNWDTEENKQVKEDVIAMLMDGTIVSSEDNRTFTFYLEHPIKGKDSGEVKLKEITFKARISKEEIDECTKGIKANNDELKGSMMMAMVCDIPHAYFNKLDNGEIADIGVVATLFLT